MSDKVKKAQKAQMADGARGALGGNYWKARDILNKMNLCTDEVVRFEYLAEGANLTAALTIARDVPLHVHKYHDELIHIFNGSGKFRVGGTYCSIEPGGVIYIPQDTIHGGTPDEELRTLSIYTPRFDIRNPDRIFMDEKGDPV